jgi:outer membrane receptor for ferrienterochelin and colicin
MQRVSRCLFVFILVLAAASVFGQAITGILNGTATTGGTPLPGVTVTVASPALQGTRSTTTGESGGYNFAGLPPGEYTVTFDLAGMQSVNKRVVVSLAQTSRVDADLNVAAVAEAITITASSPAVVETTEITTNFDVKTIRELPTGRDIRETVLLAPGVTEGAVNDQITISGAMSFDNLFLVDGVIVNENLRGQPHDLYIEDAIKETTILTGGVSAEYGKFTGGVVSTLTKSGGNEFSGSLRDSLTNPSWKDKTDFADEVDPIDELNEAYEGTFGGRVVRDRLWFFTAGRFEDRQFGDQTTLTNIPYDRTREDRRWEGKLTGQISPRHTLVGSFVQSDLHQENQIVTSADGVADLRSLTPRDDDKKLMGLNYNGIFSDTLLFEGQVSRMDHVVIRGAETRDLIDGTLLNDVDSGVRMWSPAGCGSPCSPKEFDNEDWVGKLSYFLSTRATGNHSFVGGFEEFHQFRNDNNYQSGSDFRIHGNIIRFGQDVFFGISPDDGQIEWDPVPALSKTNDFAVRSLFVNDKWELNEHWNFNVGGRYDEAFGSDQAGNKTVDDSAMSPRLAATWDIAGNGRNRFSATYGRYVAKVEQGPADNAAAAGRYASYYWDYKGPAINPPGTPREQLVPVPDVIRMVFAWFESVGGTGNDEFLDSARVPGYTTRFDGSLQSPWMDEFTIGYSHAFGAQGFVRADYIDRQWGDFYVVRRTIDTGKVVDPTGRTVDQGVIENSDDGLSRAYDAIQLQGSYRIMDRLNIGGNYTWSELWGNVEGESATGATTLTNYRNYPEYRGFDASNAEGFLGPDMRHRANLWLQFDVPTPIGELNLSVLERYHSALSYSAVGTIDVRQSSVLPNGVVNPGYATPPTNVTYFFTERGAFRVDDITSTDLAVNYSAPIGSVGLFIEADVLNLLGEQGIEDPDFVNQSVLTRRSTSCLQTGSTNRCLAFNPLAGEVPVEGVHWQKVAAFGQPIRPEAYQDPRMFRVSFGVRF